MGRRELSRLTTVAQRESAKYFTCSQKFNLSFIYEIFVKTQTCVYGRKYNLKPAWYNKTLDASFMQLC